MSNSAADKGIIVYKKTLSTQAKQAIAKAEADGKTIQIFQENDLLVNILEHTLVPEHILLTKEQKAQLLDKYKLKEGQLPRMHKTDPVAKFLGLGRGDVVKIIRPSETSGRYVTYRLVV
jgi:DNA-directed RNA polymerase I, II, and III subunit RPABC1